VEEILLKDTATNQYYRLVERRNITADNADIHTPQNIDWFLKYVQLIKPISWRAVLSHIGGSSPHLSADAAREQVAKFIKQQRRLILKVDPETAANDSTQAYGHSRTAKGEQSSSEPANLGPTHTGGSAATPETDPTIPDTTSDEPATVEGSEQGSQPVEKCETQGCPISMVSGEELLQLTDFTLPGPMPLPWQRTFRSSHQNDIGLGSGWTHSLAESLTVSGSSIEYHDSEARNIRFRRPQSRQKSRYLPEGMVLSPLPDGYLLSQRGQWDKCFTRVGHSDLYRLTEIRHAAWHKGRGFAINLHYNASGKLDEIAGNWGKALRLQRDEQGHIRQIQLHNTRTGQAKTVAEYDYNEQRQLIAHRNAAGVGEHYCFADNRLQQRTLATGFSYYYEWDEAGRCIHTWGDKGIYNYTFAWNPEEQQSTATDSRGNTTTYHYNAHGQIVSKRDPEGGDHRYHYQNGLLTSYTNPLGATEHYFFDHEQNPLGERDALDNRLTLSYFQGQCNLVRDKAGGVWRYNYNRQGLVESSTDPVGRTSHFRYTQEGLLAENRDVSGTTHYRWNNQGELTTLRLPNGIERHFSYNDWGEIVAAETRLKGQTSGALTHFSYTTTGRLAEIVNADGQRTTYRYNDNDQLLRYSDPRGRVTEFKYDGLSQVIERRDSEGHRLQYIYDKERNLTALINENGERYQFFYDGNERLTKEIGFDGRVQHYKYNAAGQLIKHLDAGEVITTFERDALGRMVSRISQRIGDDKQKETSRYLYDPLGRLLETYNDQQFLSFQYDALGNLLSETHCDLNEKRQRILSSEVTLRFKNQASGLPTALTLPEGEEISYHYNEAQRLQAVTWNGDVISQFEHDQLGRERVRHQGQLSTYSDYDPMGRLVQQRAVNQQQKHEHPIDRQYRYDHFGNLSQLNDSGTETRYVYDLLNRLQRSETQASDYYEEEHFAFDPAGNLLSQSASNSAPASQSQGNRLAFQGDRKFLYDKRGNLIRERRGKGGKLETYFEYNLQNQLVAAHKNGQSTHYRYDPLGRRISKQDTFGTSRYLWAGDQLIQETRNSLKKTYLYEPGSFKPLALAQDGKIYHYHLDHLGTPRELSDAEGNIVWRGRYKTYGKLAFKDVDDVENNLRFQGQYYDEETGLHYNRHRYYNPNTGQFISQDPIGLLGGVNNYQYAPNPVGWVDPLGLTCKEPKPNRWNEFQKRAKGQFRNPSETAEAWNKFKKREFNSMAELLDLSSPENGAVFWSGNYPAAEAFAVNLQSSVPGATTLEMTPGGSIFNGWDYLDEFFVYEDWGSGKPTDGKKLWMAISEDFAERASGEVNVVQAYEGAIWKNVEAPALDKNTAVTKIKRHKVDPPKKA